MEYNGFLPSPGRVSTGFRPGPHQPVSNDGSQSSSAGPFIARPGYHGGMGVPVLSDSLRDSRPPCPADDIRAIPRPQRHVMNVHPRQAPSSPTHQYQITHPLPSPVLYSNSSSPIIPLKRPHSLIQDQSPTLHQAQGPKRQVQVAWPPDAHCIPSVSSNAMLSVGSPQLAVFPNILPASPISAISLEDLVNAYPQASTVPACSRSSSRRQGKSVAAVLPTGSTHAHGHASLNTVASPLSHYPSMNMSPNSRTTHPQQSSPSMGALAGKMSVQYQVTPAPNVPEVKPVPQEFHMLSHPQFASVKSRPPPEPDISTICTNTQPSAPADASPCTRVAQHPLLIGASTPETPATNNAPSSLPCMDKALALVAVADECISKARVASPSIAVAPDAIRVEEYRTLIFTGLTCLEAALRSNKFSPRQDARLRLYYASLLFEETENLAHTEVALSQGLTMCEKHRYIDIKYCMNYSLSKVLFQRNHKAALVSVDRLILDASQSGHIHWVYAFRLLKAGFCIKSGNGADAFALENLHHMGGLASGRGDGAVAILASVLEGLALLKSMKASNVDKIQACVAQASRFQFDPVAKLPILELFVLLLDAATSIHDKNPEAIARKLAPLRKAFDRVPGNLDDSSEVLIPIKRHPSMSVAISRDTSAIIRAASSDGDAYDFLVVTSISKLQACVMILTLEGLAGFNHQQPPMRRSIGPWTHALALLVKAPSSGLSTELFSLNKSVGTAEWKATMSCHIHAFLALYWATHSVWVKVRESITAMSTLVSNWSQPDSIPALLLLYVTGVYHQGTGDLARALEAFCDPRLKLQGLESKRPDLDLSMLAAYNRLWIMQEPSLYNQVTQKALLGDLQPYITNHPDRELQVVHNIVQATVRRQRPTPLSDLKYNIHAALNGAKATGNTLCLAQALSLMRSSMFDKVVGAQANKSGKAALHQSQRSGNLLWQGVAQAMYAHTLEDEGNIAEAFAASEKALRLARAVFADNAELASLDDASAHARQGMPI